jgi:hypothetical protein
MKFSEETLMAYADGELDAATREAIEAQMRTDPKLAQEVVRHQVLRAKLQAAFADALVESVPERLVAAAQTAPAGNAAEVVSLSAARDARSAVVTRRWATPQWLAIAASLVIGIVGTRLVLVNDSGPVVADGGRMIANGTLAAALNTQPGGGRDATSVKTGISFVAKSGDYCRTFNIDDKEQLAGLACREGEQWRVKALAQGSKPGGGDFRMAASTLPPAILRAVEDSIAGDALDSAGEAAARQRNWKRE